MAAEGTTSNNVIRVSVIDDHPVIREALEELIKSQDDLYFVGDAGSADEAFDLLKGDTTDVAVVDLSLRDAHGLDLLQNIRTQYPGLKVVIFSMYDEGVYAERAIRAGASGYVMKSESTDRVIDAVRTVMKGEYSLSSKMVSLILGSIARGKESRPGFPLDDLTDREMEVYQMLGNGLSVSEIAKHLNISRKTVETYRRRVKEKLGLETVADLLQHAIQWTHRQAEL